MATLFGMLELNKRSLFASQHSLQTTNHNISNINNPGYSRQEVLLQTNYPSRYAVGMLGNGVAVASIRRATADFYTRQLRGETASLGEWDVHCSTLSQMEMVFNEPSETGMAHVINEFFKSWNDLAEDPTSSAARRAIVGSASTLCETFRVMDQSLQDLRENLDKQIEQKVSDINGLLKKIADMNARIVETETSRVEANDFRDERDRLLQQLARISALAVKEDEYGAVDVFIEGANVVHRSEALTLETYRDDDQGLTNLRVALRGDRVPLNISQGELSGLMESRGGYLQDARESLDRMAEIFIQKVNEIHRQGRTAAGSGFDFFEGSDARSIDVAHVIRNNPDLVASSYSGTGGDNALANDIYSLSLAPISDDEPYTLNEMYQSTVSVLGVQSLNAQNMLRNGEMIISNLEMRKESITGVNLDEELMQLSKFQQSYEAAARVLSVVEELIDTVINMT
ncbi:MAG: flagellar hook-associated protein FlgK [Candidatus Krumholzibacteriota bacterium]|nr:flagellar hook-associated protein FlgK [Candidatus Krumholzibacteriota bacterium]